MKRWVWLVFSLVGMVRFSFGQNAGLLSAGCSPDDDVSTKQETEIFLKKGIHGVFLGIPIPAEVPSILIAEEEAPETGSDALYQVNHLDGSQSCVETFIPALGAGTFNGLLDAVGSKDSINYRLSCFQSDIGYAFRNFGGDEIEVRSSPTDHSPKADYSIIPMFF
jgi:hypothetical protein